MLLNILLQRKEESYYLKISVHQSSHNHSLDKYAYRRLPKNRLYLPAEELVTMDMLRKVGLSQKKILRYIRDNTSSEPDMIDVHNLLAKLKREDERGMSVSDRVAETLGRFCESDRFAAAHADIDQEGSRRISMCITKQTSHMRVLFSSFPEAMLADATDDTNASRYKLFSFLVHDTMGRGQHVQHALITDERAETMRLAIMQFKKCNSSWPDVRSIVVDKDFTEIGVFKSEFPEARALLCRFHAIKYIQERMAKTDYGLDALQRERLKPMASLIVRAKSQEEYNQCLDYMKHELQVENSG
ncbi:Zinc finger SWIM domain-containing protein 3 [Phytophthora citrophthora]|uniref:Zinc finger SWIM domain-containing protein 3 n=1 Tax=Phytophthora citrophthora TaxID=4793 RepID=A0AAD9G1L8_9STRA|nr:Zinc finger SWIM domain-containing protein 3 [Phytophthora citrophthora]